MSVPSVTNIIFRVADPATAQALGEAMGPRDSNGVAANASESVTRAEGSSGSPLPESVRARFEGSLGADLSSVRVHTGSESAKAAQSLHAKAYTTGQDIHFGEGQYSPVDPFGMHLLAHEVAHTVQQAAGPSPSPQTKLQVSSVGDAAELEADRAADAMVAGRPASVTSASSSTINRDPLNPGITVTPIGPVDDDPFDLFPKTTPGGGPPPGAKGNAYSGDLKYHVPTTAVKGKYGATPPALSAEMPTANIPVPGAIPGWMVDAPPREYDFGGIKYTDPGGPVVVAGDQHSKMAKDAWADYKAYIGTVNSSWNTGGRTALNTIAQQGQGNAELDKLVGEMKNTFNLNIRDKKGTVTDQSRSQGVQGSSVNQVDSDVAKRANDKTLQEDMARSSAPDSGTTEDSEVRKEVKAVNAALNNIGIQAKLLSAANEDMSGLQTELGSAKKTLDALNLAKEIKEAEERKSELESGMNLVKSVSPEIARLIGLAGQTKSMLEESVKPYMDLGTGAAKVAGGDLSAIGDVLGATISLVNMNELQTVGRSISAKAAQMKGKEFAGAKEAVSGISTQVNAAIKSVEARQKKLKQAYASAKAAYSKLAATIEKNGLKGKDGKAKKGKDSKLVADALRALPTVSKLVRFLVTAKAQCPKPPDPSTRAQQGHTLAVSGLMAPGADELYKVLGWIEGAPLTVEDELRVWTNMESTLKSFVANLGVGDPKLI
jgi:hypothetical protein